MTSKQPHLAEADSAYSVSGIEELVLLYYDALVHLATTILGDASEAQDAAQETLIAAARAMDRYRGESSLKTWLYAIALNVCRRHLRKRRTRRLLVGMLEKLHVVNAHAPSTEETVAQSQASEALWAAVNTLTDNYRLPIILRYLHGLPVREIGSILNTSENAINVRIHHARRTLYLHLSSEHLPDAPEVTL